MHTNEEYREMVLLCGQRNRNKREAARLYANKFPSRRHYLIVQLPVLFNACIKLRDIFPCLMSHLQACGQQLRMFQDMPWLILKVVSGIERHIPLSHATPSSLQIPTEDVLGCALAHPENSVRDNSKACSYSKSTGGAYYIRTVHILIVQSWRRN